MFFIGNGHIITGNQDLLLLVRSEQKDGAEKMACYTAAGIVQF